MKTPLEILQGAYRLLSDHDKWTHGSMAQNNVHSPVSPNDIRAVRFCALGAVYLSAGERGTSCDRYAPETKQAIRELAASIKGWEDGTYGLPSDIHVTTKVVFTTNDHSGYDAIMEGLEKSIARLSATETPEVKLEESVEEKAEAPILVCVA